MAADGISGGISKGVFRQGSGAGLSRPGSPLARAAARVAILAALLAAWVAAFAAPVRAEALRVAPNGGPATVSGILVGSGEVRHTFRVVAGQRVRIILRSSNPELALGVEDAGPRTILPLSRGETSYSSIVSRTGTMRVTVALPRRAAERAARYTLSVELRGRVVQEGPLDPFPQPPVVDADGLYRVVGIGANDTLNVRAGPGSAFEIVAELTAGTRRLAVRGCRSAGGAQWCEIRTTRGIPVRGWVNARFLAEDRP